MSAEDDTTTSIAAAATAPITANTHAEASNIAPNEKVIFPMLLHDAVSDPTTDDCIHWLPGSNLFLISDKKKFSKKVLPTFPGNGVFTSFTRRLKRWGFERIASGPQIGAYKNEYFVRDNKELVKKMKYMAQKPMSMTAIRKNIAKLQATAGLTPAVGAAAASGDISSVGTAVNMSPDLRMMGLIQSISAHQQLANNSPFVQGQASNQSMEAIRSLVLNGGGNVAPNANMMAPIMGTGPSLQAQLAMMQSFQNQQQIMQLQAILSSQQAQQSASPSSNTKDSFGANLIRTNPQLAARLLEARNASNQGTQPLGASSNYDIMSLFNARTA